MNSRIIHAPPKQAAPDELDKKVGSLDRHMIERWSGFEIFLRHDVFGRCKVPIRKSAQVIAEALPFLNFYACSVLPPILHFNLIADSPQTKSYRPT